MNLKIVQKNEMRRTEKQRKKGNKRRRRKPNRKPIEKPNSKKEKKQTKSIMGGPATTQHTWGLCAPYRNTLNRHLRRRIMTPSALPNTATTLHTGQTACGTDVNVQYSCNCILFYFISFYYYLFVFASFSSNILGKIHDILDIHE